MLANYCQIVHLARVVGAAVRPPLGYECWYGTHVCGWRMVHALVVGAGEQED